MTIPSLDGGPSKAPKGNDDKLDLVHKYAILSGDLPVANDWPKLLPLMMRGFFMSVAIKKNIKKREGLNLFNSFFSENYFQVMIGQSLISISLRVRICGTR
jgi:hypothetical protein